MQSKVHLTHHIFKGSEMRAAKQSPNSKFISSCKSKIVSKGSYFCFSFHYGVRLPPLSVKGALEPSIFLSVSHEEGTFESKKWIIYHLASQVHIM